MVHALHEIVMAGGLSFCLVQLQALDHMHANEVILTFGHSNTTQLFLQEAAKKRSFQVYFHKQKPFRSCSFGLDNVSTCQL